MVQLRKNIKGIKNPNYRGGVSICFDCKKELKYRYSWKKEPRCRECWSRSRMGKNHPRWTGKNVKMSDGKYRQPCIVCSGETGDYYSVMCKSCRKGALHHAWRGGTSTLSQSIRALPENRQWIRQCMYRDNWMCRECGIIPKTANSLQVHHLKSFASIIKEKGIVTVDKAKECKELWDTDNGVTLCVGCHKLTENYAKKL